MFISSFIIFSKIVTLFDRDIMIENIIFHTHVIPTVDEFNSMTFQLSLTPLNYTVMLTKELRRYLGHPYSKCNNYQGEGHPFNGSSHIHCYRQCIREYIKRNMSCVPLIIDNLIHEMDFTSYESEVCSLKNDSIEMQGKVESNIRQKCLDLCPEDCVKVEYSSVIRKSENHFGTQNWFDTKETDRKIEKHILWDTSRPIIVYNEESLMSFTDYVIYCGGLMGLWFGKSVKDIFVWIIESRIWHLIWMKINYCKSQTPVISFHDNYN